MGITEEKISRDQGMTSYRCKVLSFESKMNWRPGSQISLKSFYVDGVKLKLGLYPNGATNKDKDHTSIYVENMSPDDIKIDYELSMGYRKEIVNGDIIKASDGYGFPQFFKHSLHSFLHNSKDDKNLEIVWNIKKVWKDFTDGEKIETEEQMKRLQIQVNNQNVQMKQMMEGINNLESQMKQLLKVHNNNADNMANKQTVPKPECPVCMEDMGPGTRIMQCEAGHFLCWSCSLKPEIGRVCPSCREPFVGRAHGMEAYLKTVIG